MAKTRFTFVVVGFNAAELRWCPMFRCETLERAQGLRASVCAAVAAFCEVVRMECDIEDVETIEACCAELPAVSLFEVFSAYADVADHAFKLGGSKWFRVPPEAEGLPPKRKKGGTVH